MNKKMITHIPLIALALSTFAICMAEFVIMGLIPNISNDLHISLPSAGYLISGYALGVAVGSPIMGILIKRMSTRNQLFLLMGIFVVGNAISLIASDYSFLLLGRIVASFTHGSFIGLATVAATKIVSAEKQAAAISIIFGGSTIANVLGVPFGTFIGQQFGWRATFAVLTCLGIIAVLALLLFIPKIELGERPKLSTELGALVRPRIILSLVMAIFSFGGIFATFTFIAPMLEQSIHVSPNQITWIFLIFGIGLTVGNMLTSRLAKWKSGNVLLGNAIFLAIVLGTMYWSAENIVTAFLNVFLLGAAMMGMISFLQLSIINKAKDAPNLVSIVNVSVLNLSNAAGAFAGGWVIESSLGMRALPAVSLLITVIGIALILYINYRDHKGAERISIRQYAK
ncbi:MFS transporter [Paenibacillus doosanensis]|uniref:Inner membrane transport protein YdhP n=1 Tax=Paenibacillus konkukensis TaxID=2020716 RepID=A0ABY4REN0_9BACL|nr:MULTISPECIES: MFS transporter [Paenibacillus]MCS7461333.1 MFS transporter [Paenibacillus doosanensis]UQZ81099.1 Inner membrane transport protein YdhP [Paenibacillus konkukensis]